MFGTIGHIQIKPGSKAALDALNDEWLRDIRPQVPGPVMQVMGHVAGKPEQMVFVALMQDEPTYRALAANPAQDAWFRKMMELVDGDVSWEDIEADFETA
jgi:hypothetical protein